MNIIKNKILTGISSCQSAARIYFWSFQFVLIAIIVFPIRAQNTINQPGLNPTCIAVYEVENKIFVADSGGTIFIYDGTDNALINTVSTGIQGINQMVIVEKYGKLYATNFGIYETKVAIIDANSGDLMRIMDTGDWLIQIEKDESLGKVYCLNRSGLGQIDASTDSIRYVPDSTGHEISGTTYSSLAVNPVTHEIFHLWGDTNPLHVIDAYDLNHFDVDIGGIGIGINYIENKIYIAYTGGGPSYIYNRNSGLVTQTSTYNDATILVFNPETNRMYSSIEIDGYATIVDGVTDSSFNTQRIIGAYKPYVSYATKHVFYTGSWLTILNDSTLETKEIDVGGSIGENCIAINQSNLKVFIAIAGGIQVIQDTTFNNITVDTKWEKTGLTYQSYALAAYSMNLFAGVKDDGVYLSTDNGTSWVAVSKGLFAYTTVNAFAVSGTNIFAGTEYYGVFLSTNNGTTWTAVNNGLSKQIERHVEALAVSGTNLFAGTYGGVHLSTDNGTNWTSVSTGLPDNNFVHSLTISGANLYAGTYPGGVFLSTDNGTRWKVANAGLPEYTSIIAFAVSGTNVFAGAHNDGVYLSTDNGTSWTATGLRHVSVYALAVSGTDLYAGTSSGVFLSTDNGASWTTVKGLANNSVEALAVTGMNIFAGTGTGVWKGLLNKINTSVDQTTNKSPKQFILAQNYPNPFNPSTTITYFISKRENVLLKIVDILGRDVVTLVNEQKSAGTYSIQWNAKDQASGVYFYKLTIGNNCLIKKLILLK